MTDADLTANSFQLSLDAWGRLVLTDAAGERHVDVVPVRAFPLTDPERFLSICNAQGRELVVVPSLDVLPAESRQLLKAELTRREFVPVITRIVDIAIAVEPTEWSVETDRGATKFLIEGGDAIRRTGPDRCLVTDTQGVRYLIPDRKQLDAPSRRLLEQYL